MSLAFSRHSILGFVCTAAVICLCGRVAYRHQYSWSTQISNPCFGDQTEETISKRKISSSNNSLKNLLVFKGCGTFEFPSSVYSQDLTIVSALMKIPTKKHSATDYLNWVKIALSSIRAAPVVIYTTPEMLPTFAELLRTHGGQATPHLALVLCDDIWSVPWLRRKVVSAGENWSSVEEIYYNQQYRLDPEWKLHSPDLYAMWNSKPWMTAQVAKWNPFASKYFVWVDIGAWRSHQFRHWPSTQHFRRLLLFGENKMVVGLVTPISQFDIDSYQPNRGPLARDLFQGGFFAGSKDAVGWWLEGYTRLHDYFVHDGRFVGKDQHLINSLVLLHCHKVLMIDAGNLPPSCGDRWFYFSHFLADHREKKSNCPTTQIITCSHRRQLVKLPSIFCH